MPLHLAPLERQQSLLRALVALDHLEPGSQQAIHQPRIVGRRRRRGGAADDQLMRLRSGMVATGDGSRMNMSPTSCCGVPIQLNFEAT